VSTATLNGIACLSASVHLPAWGIWFADCLLDVEAILTGAVEFKIADLALTGTWLSGKPWLGRTSVRVVGGAGGWSRRCASKSYASAAGVRLETVIGDAARDAGETVAGVPTGIVGQAWTREAGAPSIVLHQLCPRAWYVSEDGVTRFGKRPATVWGGADTRGKVDLSAGYVELMADSIAGLVPGVVVEGVEAVDVVHVLENSKLRSTIWGSAIAPTSKRLAAWAALFAQLDPFARYRAQYEYRVVTQDGERLNLQPIRASLGMPDLRDVRAMPGVAGCRADVQLGGSVVVAFLNADPAQPRVVGFEDAEGEGFAPERLDLVGADDLAVLPSDSIKRVVRYGDPIVFSSPGPGVVTLPAAGSLSRVRA
jgi:hypothetical protein